MSGVLNTYSGSLSHLLVLCPISFLHVSEDLMNIHIIYRVRSVNSIKLQSQNPHSFEPSTGLGCLFNSASSRYAFPESKNLPLQARLARERHQSRCLEPLADPPHIDSTGDARNLVHRVVLLADDPIGQLLLLDGGGSDADEADEEKLTRHAPGRFVRDQPATFGTRDVVFCAPRLGVPVQV